MDSLTFLDGITTLFLVQSIIVGILLVFDSNRRNVFLGIFVLVYSTNSSRIILYKLSEYSAFIELYAGLSFAGFFTPLLYLFLKSQISKVGVRTLVYHSIVPFIYLIFSFLYTSSSQVLENLCSDETFVVLTHSLLACLDIIYGYLIIQIIRNSAKWKEILRSVRLKNSWFVLGIMMYLFMISTRVLIYQVFDWTLIPGDTIYVIQRILFYVVFAVVPVYAYTVLSKYKKFIQPKSIYSGLAAQSGLSKTIAKLIDQDKLHINPDFDSNELSGKLNVPLTELRVFFKNEYGKTIPQYLTDKRLEEFIMEADKGKEVYNIEGLALNAGFKSRPTFYRAFKKKYGETPTEYLNM